MRFEVSVSNSEKAKELKAMFSELLGTPVLCKKGTGSMKCYYAIRPREKDSDGCSRAFTDSEAKLIKAKLIELRGFISIEKITEATLDLHFVYQVNFMLEV